MMQVEVKKGFAKADLVELIAPSRLERRLPAGRSAGLRPAMN